MYLPLVPRTRDYHEKKKTRKSSRARREISPRSSLAGYVFLEIYSNFHTPSVNLLDARSELCRPDKEGLSAAGERKR